MDFETIVTSRRAVNFFDEQRPVSEDLIRKMVEMAALAPSSFNLQPWNLVVLTDRADKERLQKCAMNQPKVSQAPVTMIVLADRNGYQEDCPTVEKVFQDNIRSGAMTEAQRDWFKNARNSLYGKSDKFIQAFACKNAGFFAMSLMFAAKSLGLDTHPMDGFDHDAVIKEFNIPDHFHIPLLLAVGYFNASQKLAAPKWRKSYSEIVVSF